MDDVTRRQQKKLMKKTQKRLNRLMDLLLKLHLSKRSNVDNEVFETFVRRSIASDMLSSGFSPGPFGITATPTIGSDSTTTEGPDDDMLAMCNDIRGRDRACCNSAVQCFSDVRGVLDELENIAPGSFTLQSACRQVSSELKRDKLCVQQSLSRCSGPDRGLLQRRFDGRVSTLYDQFYTHCRASPPPAKPSSTTTTPAPTTSTAASKFQPTAREETETPRPTPAGRPEVPTNFFPTGSPHDHSGHGGHTRGTPAEVTEPGASGALAAGVIAGGIIFGLILILVIVLWCRRRRDKNGSNGSMSSRTGIFFQKRSNMFRSERPGGGLNNNSKHPVTRQESDIYAEIDEDMVNPGYKPPVPSSLSLPGYLNPVSDEDSSSSYTPPPTSQPRQTGSPFVTTRGQMSYGPILAANGGADHVTPYHSTTLTFSDKKQKDSKAKSDTTIAPLSPKNLPMDVKSDDVGFRMSDVTDFSDDGLDDYEQPISTHSSMRYATLDKSGPPETFAPAVPVTESKDKSVENTNKKSSSTEAKKKTGVKVLPSNPFAPHPGSPRTSAIEKERSSATTPKEEESKTAESTSQPVPQPRKKKEHQQQLQQQQQASKKTKPPVDKSRKPSVPSVSNAKSASPAVTTDEVKNPKLALEKREDANRDSHVSTKSSHHYFVLEPEATGKHGPLDYENSVSSPKLV